MGKDVGLPLWETNPGHNRDRRSGAELAVRRPGLAGMEFGVVLAFQWPPRV